MLFTVATAYKKYPKDLPKLKQQFNTTRGKELKYLSSNSMLQISLVACMNNQITSLVKSATLGDTN